jgi:hypothetical protein
MFYEDSNPTTHHVAATSNDGVHFTVQGALTTIGLDPDSPEASWGDMAYDLKTGMPLSIDLFATPQLPETSWNADSLVSNSTAYRMKPS